MSVGKYLPGASYSIFAVRDDVVQCKMNSYWSTLVLKVCLAPPPIIDKRYVLNTRQCSAVQWSNYWSNLSTHENVNWYRSDLLTHFAFLLYCEFSDTHVTCMSTQCISWSILHGHILFNRSADVSDCGRYVIVTISRGCDPVNMLYYSDLQETDYKINGKYYFCKACFCSIATCNNIV